MPNEAMLSTRDSWAYPAANTLDEGGLRNVLFSREQIYVSSKYSLVMKEWQKAVYRHAGSSSLGKVQLIKFSRDWFQTQVQDLKERLEREEAWRKEWTGRKLMVKELFDRFDQNGNGVVTFDELSCVLAEFPHFFGFSVNGFEHVGEWIKEEVDQGRLGAEALFEKLDKDGSGDVTFEEFWEVVGEWMDSGFDALEELKQKRKERLREMELLKAERKAKEERERVEAEARARAAQEAADAARRRREEAEAAAAASKKREQEAADEAKRKAEERARIMAAVKQREEEARAAAAAEEEARQRKLYEDAEKARAANAEACACAVRASARTKAVRKLREEEAKEAARRAEEEAAAAKEAEAAAHAASLKASQLRLWEEAVQAMLDESRDVATCAQVGQAVIRNLRRGEPDIGPQATFVLMLSDDGARDLSVVEASDEAKAQAEANWSKKSSSPMAKTAHDVVAAGEADDADGVAFAPLAQADGYTFGVLLSAAPCVPAEFLGMMAASAGPVIESKWRDAKVAALVDVAKMWISMLDASDCLESVELLDDDGAPGGLIDDETYVLPLSKSRGHLRIVCQPKKTFRTQSALRNSLEATKPLLGQAIDAIEQMRIGDQAPSWMCLGDVGADDAAKLMLPRLLQMQVRHELSNLDPKKTIAEIRSYSSPPKVVPKVMAGVLCALGRRLKDLSEWKQIRLELKDTLLAEMDALDPAKKSKKRPWRESQQATKGVILEEVNDKGSVAAQVVFKWLEVSRLVRKISIMLRKEDEANDKDDDD